MYLNNDWRLHFFEVLLRASQGYRRSKPSQARSQSSSIAVLPFYSGLTSSLFVLCDFSCRPWFINVAGFPSLSWKLLFHGLGWLRIPSHLVPRELTWICSWKSCSKFYPSREASGKGKSGSSWTAGMEPRRQGRACRLGLAAPALWSFHWWGCQLNK